MVWFSLERRQSLSHFWDSISTCGGGRASETLIQRVNILWARCHPRSRSHVNKGGGPSWWRTKFGLCSGLCQNSCCLCFRLRLFGCQSSWWLSHGIKHQGMIWYVGQQRQDSVREGFLVSKHQDNTLITSTKSPLTQFESNNKNRQFSRRGRERQANENSSRFSSRPPFVCLGCRLQESHVIAHVSIKSCEFLSPGKLPQLPPQSRPSSFQLWFLSQLGPTFGIAVGKRFPLSADKSLLQLILGSNGIKEGMFGITGVSYLCLRGWRETKTWHTSCGHWAFSRSLLRKLCLKSLNEKLRAPVRFVSDFKI